MTGNDVREPKHISKHFKYTKGRYSNGGTLTGMVRIPSASNMHGTATLSMGVCWHMIVQMERVDVTIRW
jgi:hypothetical protein